jgi:hypothetical protein
MLILLSLALLFLTLLPILSILKLKGGSSVLLGSYLLGFGLIVFTSEISGFVGLLDKKWFFLLLQLCELITAWAIWRKSKQPSLILVQAWTSIAKLWSWIKDKYNGHAFIGILTLLVTAGYGILAWLIIRVPPNNSDSMHTHLARVIYWLQQGSFKQLTSHSIFAKIYPFDAQLNVLWTVLFTGNDKFVGFVQFFAALATALAIYGICRQLKARKQTSILVSLIWLMLPLIVFEATTTQFDLVVTALFVTSVFFFFDYYNQHNNSSLLVSGLAMGLAVGTKQTVFMMGPALLVIAIILYVQNKHNLPWMLRWIATVVVSFLLLGSYPYFNNLHYYGNPLGPTDHVDADSLGSYTYGQKLRYNTPRFIYQYISFDALPLLLANPANDFKNQVFTNLNNTFNLEMEAPIGQKTPDYGFSLNATPRYNEDESWFGFAGTLLFIPAIIAGLINGLKKKDLIAISLVLFSISFYFCELLLRPGWDRYQGRYFIMAVAAIMPLCVYLFDHKIPSRLFQIFIAILSIITFFMAVFSNESKPILGMRTFTEKYTQMENTYIPKGPIEGYYRKYALKYYSLMTYNLPFSKTIEDYSDTQLRVLSSRSLHEQILETYNQMLPENATVGIMLVNGDFDYIFFGPKFSHRLINIEPVSLLNDPNWIHQSGIEYVLIADYQRIQTIPPYLKLMATVNTWQLFSVNN